MIPLASLGDGQVVSEDLTNPNQFGEPFLRFPSRSLCALSCAYFFLIVGAHAQTEVSTPTVNVANDGEARIRLTHIFSSYSPLTKSPLRIDLLVHETGKDDASVCLQMHGSRKMRRTHQRMSESTASDLSINDSGAVALKRSKDQGSASIALNAKVPEFPYLGILRRLDDPSVAVTDLGAEQGTEHFHLEGAVDTNLSATLTTIAKRQSSLDLYVDLDSKRLMQLKYWIFSPTNLSNSGQVTVSYQAYQQIEGVAIPFHVVKTIGGVTLSDASVNKVNLHSEPFVVEEVQ
ncbi:hypothetical protein ACFQBQ_00680 [Granulicella cerasi]|uniref:Outer membrane lipoprotein-sorting protein n=1 Tax=Granulicella cerasi TaxID=741063 RepID=A0ABW1Z403_9BACT|nr:hypothetical protein [Granulicella cerasi]